MVFGCRRVLFGWMVLGIVVVCVVVSEDKTWDCCGWRGASRIFGICVVVECTVSRLSILGE